MHIDSNQENIDISDTTGSWHDFASEIVESTSGYGSAFRTPSELYLVYGSSTFSEYFGSDSYNSIEKFSNNESQIYSGYWAQDVPWVFGITTGIYPIEEGYWLVNDTFGYAFVSNNDSITIRSDYILELPYVIVHIAGKINEKHLCYCWDFEDSGKFKPYIIDLSDSPLVDSSHVSSIKINENQLVTRIQQVGQNQFLISNGSHNLGIYYIENDSLCLSKLLLDKFYAPKWIYREPFIYRFQYTRLFRYNYQTDTQVISDPDTLIYLDVHNESIGIDVELKYSVYTQNDSLYLYNIDSTIITNVWDLSSLNNARDPIISYPDIFIHNTTSITNIENNEKQIPIQFDVETYPNPFNSAINISISNTIESNFSIQIFDIRGRVVHKFEVRPEFNTTSSIYWKPESHIASGLYLLKVQGARAIKTKKLIYLK